MRKKNLSKKKSDGQGSLGYMKKVFDKKYGNKEYLVSLEIANEMVEKYPDSPMAWESLANAFGRNGFLKKAAFAMDKCLEIGGAIDAAILKRAQYYILSGMSSQVIDDLQTLANQGYKGFTVFFWLSRAYHSIGKNEEALTWNEAAFQIKSDDADMLSWRARIFEQLKRPEDSMFTLRKLIDLYPGYTGSYNHLATLLVKEGLYEEAEFYFRKEISLSDNNKQVMCNLLVSMHYNPKYSNADLVAYACKWEELHAEKEVLHPAVTTAIPNKKIKVALLSGGFRTHPVGQMILPLLENLDSEEIEPIAYSTSQVEDLITKKIKESVTSWSVVDGDSDQELEERIKNDKVDLLIDLNGPGDGCRYSALSRKPAPLIVKWVGSLINTTGLKCFDYLLSDSIETPLNVDDGYVEKLIRLPDDYICYHIPSYMPRASSLPALEKGYITFGCLNNPAKLSPELIDEWSKLINEVRGSKILLRGVEFERVSFRERIKSYFFKNGVLEEQIIFEGPAPHKEFIATYQKIDIALDTWPYSGGLTTCEALAMGVPVISCVGPTFAGRHSATHLANAGLPELVTDNWDDFRKRAKELAFDLPNLAVIRAALPTIFRESPVCDGARFAKHFTKAMRGIWQRYCEGKAPEALTFNKEGDAWFADEDRPIELAKVEAKPELQEADFEWSLESPITVIDNGALFVRHPRFTEWVQTGNFAVITFDPGSLLTKQADELKQLGEWHHYPHATLGDGKDATLYATLDPELTGTLQPLEEQQTGEQDDSLRVLSTLPISTVALDAIEGLPGVDLLVLDSLNDAMAILGNGHTYLANTLLLQVKLAFQPTHQRQPNLAEVQHWMAHHGFRFYRFNNEQHRSYLPESVPSEKRQATELTSADAIFLPSHERMASLANHQKTKLAFLLHTIYGIKDMAYELLFQLDEEQAQGYWARAGVVEKKCLVSSLSKEASKENNSYGFVLEKYKESIDYLDVKDTLNYSYSNPTGVAVVMPCIDREQGLRTAATLIERAGMPVKVIVAFDSLQQGFIETLNLVSKKCKVKYVIYLAQDAFPGRGWLASAYNALEKSGRGLLAFNDGKWNGRIASFGMVRKSWAYSLYNESILCAEYNSHCADDELTIIARCNNELYYDPEIVLIEVDYNKGMVGGGNAQDRSRLYSRAEKLFEGKVKERTFSKIAPEYNLKRVKNSFVKRGLASDVVKELVSIVIPAYKSRWFEEALKSALSQEKVVFEIIICDDSSDDKIKSIVDKYSLLADGVIRYYKNESPLGEVLNLVKCIEKASGDFIKPLYDDDVLNPYASFELLRALNCSGDVALASSRRQIIDENSDLISESPIAYAFPFSTDVYIDGKSLVSIFAHGLVNFIGEPSCVMFKRELAKSFGDKFYSLAGHPIKGRGDLAAWMNLLRLGDLVMLNKSLSFFRVSDQQASQASRVDGNAVGITTFKKMIRQLGWYNGKEYIKAAPLNERSNLTKVDLLSFWRTGLPINFGDKVVESSLDTSCIAKIKRNLQRVISSGESLKALESMQEKIPERKFHSHTHVLYDIRTLLGEREANYLEIGAYVGHSASLMLSHKFKTNVHCIDPLCLPVSHFQGSKSQEITLAENLEKIGGSYEIVKGYSAEDRVINLFANSGKKFDILFIDGDHSIQGVLNDFYNYEKMVAKGGFIVFDDYWDAKHSPEVYDAVQEIVCFIKKNALPYLVLGSLENTQHAPPVWSEGDRKGLLNEFILVKCY